MKSCLHCHSHRAFALVLLALSVAGLAAFGTQSALASTGVNVPGNYEGWTQTGVTVAAGQFVHITATGCVDRGGGVLLDPNGNLCGQSVPPPSGSYTLLCPAGVVVSLVGRIGNTCFTVGSDITMISGASGQIELGFNDAVNVRGFIDNSGSYTAFITVTDPPNPDETSSWSGLKALYR